jgi:hypothetical protein
VLRRRPAGLSRGRSDPSSSTRGGDQRPAALHEHQGASRRVGLLGTSPLTITVSNGQNTRASSQRSSRTGSRVITAAERARSPEQDHCAHREEHTEDAAQAESPRRAKHDRGEQQPDEEQGARRHAHGVVCFFRIISLSQSVTAVPLRLGLVIAPWW